jgi:hypothetical protein
VRAGNTVRATLITACSVRQNVLAVPSHDSSAARHETIVQLLRFLSAAPARSGLGRGALDCSRNDPSRPNELETRQRWTAQFFFHVRNTKNAEEVLDTVQGYLAALPHNGQIGDHTP